MRYISLIARAALLAVILVAAPQISDAASPADEALAKAVSRKLMDDKNFDATNLIVTAEDGKVFVRGQMKRNSDINKVRSSVMGVPGVKTVVEEIDVPEGR